MGLQTYASRLAGPAWTSQRPQHGDKRRARGSSITGSVCRTRFLRTSVCCHSRPTCPAPCVSYHIKHCNTTKAICLKLGINTCSLKDDDLAGRIGLQAKELNKLMAVLTNDRLVHVLVYWYSDIHPVNQTDTQLSSKWAQGRGPTVYRSAILLRRFPALL